MNNESSPPAEPGAPTAFFESVDWAAFGLTTLPTLAVYWLTLAPEVDLEYSGILAPGALYSGVTVPPGHPLWVLYGWVFIKLFPFGNIAARLALASAMAAALTCGLIALLVSRMGWMALGTMADNGGFLLRESRRLRLVCGGVAGLAFGMDGSLWRQAVVPETWSLEVLLLAIMLCLVTRWMFRAAQRRWLWAAALTCGLSLSESQALLPAVLGVPFIVALADRKIGRDLFAMLVLLLGAAFILCLCFSGRGFVVGELVSRTSWWLGMILIAATAGAALAINTRGIFSEWRTVALGLILLLAGLGACFLLPVFSLTNPPVNWGYARSVDGFFHVLDRGQFESVRLTDSWSRLIMQLGLYFAMLNDDLGGVYLLAAVIPLIFWRRMAPPARNWMVGLLVLGLILGLLTIMGLNSERSTAAYGAPYFAASHLVIVLFAGCGLMQLAAWFAGATVTTRTPETQTREIARTD